MGVNTPHPQAILCLDIDGTLLDSNEQVHPNDVRIFQHCPPEIQLILTTGRPLNSAKPVLRMNRVFDEEKLPIPGVFINGGAAYLPNEQLCFKHPLSPQTSQTLLELSGAFPNSEFVFCTVSEAYRVNPTALGQHICESHHLNVVGGMDSIPHEKIIKVMAFNNDPAELDLIRQATRRIKAEMAVSLPFIFEFNPPGITKANTLLQLLKELELENIPIFSAGDGENDLSLFRLAQRSFAPETAHPAILERADQIIARNKNGLLQPIFEQIIN